MTTFAIVMTGRRRSLKGRGRGEIREVKRVLRVVGRGVVRNIVWLV